MMAGSYGDMEEDASEELSREGLSPETIAPAEKRPGLRLGLYLSIGFHVLIALAFLLYLYPWQPSAEAAKEENTVEVQLVDPPPEKPKPEPEKKPEPPKPTPKPVTPPPPPPPPPPPAKPVEPPKPPEKPPEAQPPKPPAAPPPPPPPPPPPKPAGEDEQKPQSQPEKAEEKSSPLPIAQPVFKFGDKDTGAKQEDAGNAAKKTGDPKATDDIKSDDDASDTADADKPAPKSAPLPKDIDLPQVATADSHPEPADNGPSGHDNIKAKIETEKAAAKLTSPSETKKAGAHRAKGELSDKLESAKTLFSSGPADDEARAAMQGVPREKRIGVLCRTEFAQQLSNGTPPYYPSIVPQYPGGAGAVLTVDLGAFRDFSGWHDFSFRCEVDKDATTVVSFAYKVGELVPRDQWRRRGFPEN